MGSSVLSVLKVQCGNKEASDTGVGVIQAGEETMTSGFCMIDWREGGESINEKKVFVYSMKHTWLSTSIKICKNTMSGLASYFVA